MYRIGSIMLIALFLALSPMGASAADHKVGVVDMADIIMKSADGKTAQANLERKRTELGKSLESQKKEIDKMIEDFNKQAQVMKEEAKKKRGEEISKRMDEFRKKAGDADRQMGQIEEKEMGPVIQKFKVAADAVAKANGVDLLLNKATPGIIYLNPSLDFTEKVREKFGK